MKKAQLNFVVDAAAFVAFLFLTTTGVLVRYVLPAGSGHGRTLWSLDRHAWGDVHFWTAAALLLALALHVFLHWRWVWCMVRGRPAADGSGPRVALAAIGLLGLVALLAAPLLGEVRQTKAPGHEEEGSRSVGPSIEGSMTLEEVERLTGVPAAWLLSELGLPPDTSPEEKLGHLRRQHGFAIDDVRDVVRRHGRTEP